jgi:hypothetical protein
VTVRRLVPVLPAASLGVLAAVLVSCGSSGAGLIPSEDAGPLLSDFQAVERAAREGNGSCAATETAIRTTEHDFQRLSAIDTGLHARLQEGVSRLRELALEACAQPLSQTTATGESTATTKTPTPSPTTTAGTQTTSTSPTQTTSTTGGATATTPGPTQTSGGTEGGTAPGTGSSEGQAGESSSREGAKNGAGSEDTGSGGTGSGGTGGGGGGQ